LITTIQFEVPGKPFPFVAQYQKLDWVKRKAFAEYCKGVRTAAMVAGVRDLKATRDAPLYIHTRAWFRDGRHPDPENVHKVIVDALLYGKSSARDKFTGGAYTPPLYDKANPRVEVVIADGRRPLIETLPEGW